MMKNCRYGIRDSFFKKGRRRTRFLIAWLMILLQASVLTGCASGQGSESGKEGVEKESMEEESAGDGSTNNPGKEQTEEPSAESGDVLRVQVLKVGKADAIVLSCGGKTMVIDCGEEEDGQEVLAYLQAEGVSEIDVLMITHFDKDHVGGADTVMNGMPVSRVLLPAYTGSGTEYKDFMEALQKTAAEPENILEPVRFQLGDALVLVEPPASYQIPNDAANNDTEYDNNFSLVTTVEFCGQRMIFAGDIEKQRICEWLAHGDREPCAVLKVPHHGVYNKALEDLFGTLQPAYAIICDSKKNPADERTLELLRQCGVECLETKDGDISVLCGSEGIEIRQ